jgi:hypothetical protein
MPPFSEYLNGQASSCKSLSEFDIKSPKTLTRTHQNAVRFAQFDEVFEIPHINDLSDEELDGVWMSPKELRSIRRGCKLTILSFEGQTTEWNDIAMRGLEQHTIEYSRTRKATRQQLYKAVFEIQSFQTFQGVSVPELIAKMSQKCSSSSVVAAHGTGISDAFDACR